MFWAAWPLHLCDLGSVAAASACFGQRGRCICVFWAAWPFAFVTRLQVIAVMRSDDEGQSWVPLSHIYTKSSRNGMPGAVLLPTGSSSDRHTMGANYSIVVIHEGFLENKWDNYSVHSAGLGVCFQLLHPLKLLDLLMNSFAYNSIPPLNPPQCPTTAAHPGSSDQTCLYRRRASTLAVRR